jgi:negative regulator of flagellin synthesis FlgM
MISKIKDANAPLIQQYQKSDAVKKDAETQAQTGITSTLTEKVDLSAKAKDIQKIKQIVEQTPDVRADKVQALKHQIETGNYQVDAAKVAENLVKQSLIDIII